MTDNTENSTHDVEPELEPGADSGVQHAGEEQDGSQPSAEASADESVESTDGSAGAAPTEEQAFLLEQLQRSRAELDNFRRRTVAEKDRLRRQVIADVVREILPCVDDLDMAAKSGGDEDPVAKGVQLTLEKLDRVLSDLGIEALGVGGESFDPGLHEAMLHVESGEIEAGHIVDVYSRGYRIGDVLIRAARVTVAKG